MMSLTHDDREPDQITVRDFLLVLAIGCVSGFGIFIAAVCAVAK